MKTKLYFINSNAANEYILSDIYNKDSKYIFNELNTSLYSECIYSW